MSDLKIVKIVLRSGVQIDTSNALGIEVVLREERYIDVDEYDVKKERARYETFLRIERDNSFFEIREREVAAFEYAKNNDIVI